MKGNRKFWITLIALVGGFVLGLMGKLTADYAMIATMCVGAFSAANAYEHKVNAKAPGAA